MPFDIERMSRRIEALEQGLRELLQRLVDLEEMVKEQSDRRSSYQNTTINWWETWQREGDS